MIMHDGIPFCCRNCDFWQEKANIMGTRYGYCKLSPKEQWTDENNWCGMGYFLGEISNDIKKIKVATARMLIKGEQNASEVG